MFRLVLLIALALAMYYFVVGALRRLGQLTRRVTDAARTAQRSGEGRQQPARVEHRLVACHACGIHVPTSRALPAGRGSGELYCSQTCRQRATVAS